MNVTLKFSFCFCLYLVLFVYKFCIIYFREVGCRKDICDLYLIQGFNPMLFWQIEGPWQLGDGTSRLRQRCILHKHVCKNEFFYFLFFNNVCTDIILGQIVVSIAILNKYFLFQLILLSKYILSKQPRHIIWLFSYDG